MVFKDVALEVGIGTVQFGGGAGRTEKQVLGGKERSGKVRRSGGGVAALEMVLPEAFGGKGRRADNYRWEEGREGDLKLRGKT